MTAKPPLAAVATAHRTLNTVLADLTDTAVTGPSLLPGWTRGHVLAHLADAARARARVVEHALRGEVVVMWEPGERDAVIKATATRSAAEHRAAVAEHAERLDRAWAGVEDWTGFDSAVEIRWREVWIHLVDLDVGVRPKAWTLDFSLHAVDFLHTRLPDGFGVRATDVDRAWGSGAEITGAAHDLAAWLAGRVPDEWPSGPLPELGPWPAYR
ncbi:maleylpyruvate isomerase family mycothiol-dependent enzyme [Umezawaea endophytica]|uniref:Maleylpyruvate isomerase family mycothiol-dependent enzyme n=1 Tax=Umezawaea endophytica TaxID=1654476 RepID=A0A9X2VL18_9PSEU|nr:maleylpyruvate isomerase family mycothiol-dependent enzyme [Umezawaea endophytica]MCS7478608.1 maleylpyruvate isomerase family mycothiol-dependent enzyme [Umezawaea endophytica]